MPSTRKMADPNYCKNLVNPNFTEVTPRFSRIQLAVAITPRNRIPNLFDAARFVSKIAPTTRYRRVVGAILSMLASRLAFE